MTSDLSFPNMWFDLEPNEDVDHLLQPGEELALSSTFAFGGDNALTEMEGADGSIPSNGSTCSDDFVGEGISPNSSSFKNKQDVELDNNARMIEELSGLNLRIYKATSISPMRVLRDEIIEMTSNLLQILAASVDAARKPNHPVCTRDSLSSRVDHRFCQDSVELSNNHRTGARFPDTGSILMIFACYQRFLDLFKQVCLKLHRKLGGYYRPDGIPLVSVANHRCDTDSSTAQVVMTLELISHLLGRLHRGLHQLIMALSVDTQPPYSPETTPICSFSNIVSGSAVQPKEYPTRSGSSGDLPDGSEPRATARANCFQGAKFVIENMAQTQSSLYAHIKLIRASIEESHGI